MFNRQRTSPDSRPDLEGSREPSLRSALADSAWVAQDRFRSGFGGMLDRLAWVFQRGLIWPLQDRLSGLDGAGRGIAFAAAIVLAAGAGVAGLLWAAPDRPSSTSPQPVAVSQPLAEAPVPPVAAAAAPTLQGAAPVFEPKAGAVAKGKAVERSNPAKQPADPTAAAAADEEISSSPSTSSSTATAAKASNVDGPPAGPVAVAVAREFADAFVRYETGGDEASVRKAFGATASPRLSRSLLRRPPRLPASVKVPQAKVVNVVAGPSHGGVYTVSVALLRVGLTSELRLDMERQKGKRWLVTNVLG